MSVIAALFEALDAAVSADAGLQELDVSWYAGKAPATAVPPYVVADSPNEGNQNRLGRRGALDVVTLNFWHVNFMAAANLYNELHRLLHLQPMTIAGHTLDRGDLSLLTIFEDPGGHFHGIAEYRAMTKVAVETSP